MPKPTGCCKSDNSRLLLVTVILGVVVTCLTARFHTCNTPFGRAPSFHLSRCQVAFGLSTNSSSTQTTGNRALQQDRRGLYSTMGRKDPSGEPAPELTATVSRPLRTLLQARLSALRSISRLSAVAGQRGVQPRQKELITAQAGTGLGFNPVGINFGATGRIGGVTKNLYNFSSSSDQQTANTSGHYRSAAIGLPGFARVTGRSGADSLVLSQTPGQAKNSSKGSGSSSSSSSDTRGAGSSVRDAAAAPTPVRQDNIEVLLAASRDYALAGDAAVVTLRESVEPIPGFPMRRRNRRNPYALDYDYGTPQLPQTVDSLTSMRAWLDKGKGRAAAGGRTGATVTGSAVTARSHSTSTSLKGVLSAEDRTGDLFTNPFSSSIIATPPVPFKQAGADAAVVASAKSYKLSFRPSVAAVATASSSGVDAQQAPKNTGASSTLLSYVAGVQTWPSRSTKLLDTTNASFEDDNALAGGRSRPSPGAAAVVASAVEEGRRREHRDDAPMTPVVYVVLWTSMAVGGLRGYALNSSLAARVGPAYTYFFSHRHQSEVLRTDSPYCTNGVDGLPGVSWYEFAIATIPPVLAPILAAVFVNYRGRKAGIMLGCVLMMIGQVLLASSQLLVQLYIGQAFVLTASDVLFLCVALQCIEIAPRTSRGSFLVVHIVGYAVGSCVVAVIGYLVSSPSNLGWRLLYAMGTLPAMAVLVITPWLYETPHSSIERGCYAEGWEALREIRGPFYDDTYAEFMSIVRAAAAAPKGFLMYAELFRKRNYWPGICVGIAMATVAALLDPLSKTYVAYQTLARSGVSYNNAVLMSSLSLHGAYAVGALICVVLVDRIGRLPLLRASSTMAVLAVGALVAASLVYVTMHGVYGHKVTDTPHSWPRLQLATLAILAGGNGIAWSSAMWVIICESQSLAVRPAAVALCIAAFNLAASVLESKLLCVLQPLYHVVVLGVSFIAVVIAFGFVPETARVSLEDISDLYARHWWWSRVVNPRPRRRPRSTANKSRPTEGQNLPPGPRDRGSSPAISGGGGSMEPDRAAFRGKDAAALADDFPLSGPQSALPQPSPFGRTNIQTVPSQSMEEAVGDDPKTAEAVAAAAKIALAGAASSAAASLHSSQALQLGRSSRRPLRLAGKRRNSHAIEGATADVVEQLADELEVNDYGG